MFTQHAVYPAPLLELVAQAEKAAQAIPPAFPLNATVAVNPFLGQSSEPVAVTAARLARVAGIRIFPDRRGAAELIASGEITPEDLAEGLRKHAGGFVKMDLAELRAGAKESPAAPSAIPTIAELAAQASGMDWPALIADRIGAWAGAHFDQGQALWQIARPAAAFQSWRKWAIRDLTPEIQGLVGFGQFVNDSSRSPWRNLGRACETLGVDATTASSVFHRLLCDLGGWAQFARHLDWNAALTGEKDNTATELLALRLMFEEALYTQYHDQIADRWADALAKHSAPIVPSRDDIIDAALQEAVERAEQRKLATRFAPPAEARAARPEVQAAFCIDVRSEVIRRAIEATSPNVETLGFAGFFGLPVAHRPQASDIVDACAPVLLSPSLETRDDVDADTDTGLRLKHRAQRAWGRFKLAAVSSFAFVEAAGPIFAAKLVTNGMAKSKSHKETPTPVFAQDLDQPTRVGMAEGVLRAMSLTSGFAPIVVIAGHGASVTNNAHASALQCGACGGHAGDVNARLLAGLLNTPGVRQGLAELGIEIPADTLFLGALHDTTTDVITLFDDTPSQAHNEAISKVKSIFERAGDVARAERALRLPGATDGASLSARAADWSQLRPEWGLAGCRAFVVAPRAVSRDGSLDGKSFLHSYDWKKDDGFGVLETIMTAPVVVASWISLQYYGSCVAPTLFGGGNKLLHNVVGGFGVLEGNGGAIRAGLPWQSVHDGAAFQHDPLRLSVIVAAPKEAIGEILRKHEQVRALFDNGWLHLIAMDDEGRLTDRYDGNLDWTPMDATGAIETTIAAE
jgi:uncharacterized protein YbcC (UPF0753/DUF2309 family)